MNWYRFSYKVALLAIVSAILYFTIDYTWLQLRVASDTVFLLRDVLGLPFSSEGHIISIGPMTAEVSKDCTAVQALIIFVGALFLFVPIRLRQKVAISALAALTIYYVNVVRIALELTLAVTTTISWDVIHSATGMILGASTVAGLVIAADKYSGSFRNPNLVSSAPRVRLRRAH